MSIYLQDSNVVAVVRMDKTSGFVVHQNKPNEWAVHAYTLLHDADGPAELYWGSYCDSKERALVVLATRVLRELEETA